MTGIEIFFAASALCLAALIGVVKLFEGAADIDQYPSIKATLSRISLTAGILALFAAGALSGSKIKNTQGANYTVAGFVGAVIVVAAAAILVYGLIRYENSRRERNRILHLHCQCNCSGCEIPKHPLAGCGCTCSRCASLHADALGRKLAGVKSTDPVPPGEVQLEVGVSLRGEGFRFEEHPDWERSKDGSRTWLRDARTIRADTPYAPPSFVRVPGPPTQQSR